MKFYIASKRKNYQQVRRLSGLLKDSGWSHTYDWTEHCSLAEMDFETLRAIGEKDFNGVKDADVVIILTPEGGGTHAELGMAVALNKRIYICHSDDTYFRPDDNTCVFYWLSHVEQVIGDTESIARRILGLNE